MTTWPSGLAVVVLAAGQGRRMHSRQPKVLHALAGRPLLEHVLAAAHALEPTSIHVVHGHGAEAVRAACADAAVHWVLQAEQLGTGHALAQALPQLRDEALVLVLYGDVPLIEPATLRALCAAAQETALALLTTRVADPTGYGRIVRDRAGAVLRIVEERDASDAERGIHEINTGFLAARAGALRGWLARLDRHNAQGEYYLTDVVAEAVRDEVGIHTVTSTDPLQTAGVNDRAQLAALERAYQARQAQALLTAGLGLLDPQRFDLRGTLEFEQDCGIDVGVVLQGRVRLGAGVRIGAYCVLTDCELADGVEVLPHSVLEGTRIGAGARIGPFARLRPGTLLAAGVHVGNFVEIKQTSVGTDSKINHLSYVGDALIGARVNVGAGTITCNFDGAEKHLTEIGNDVFIGSDTQLVAPVRVGDGATLGAGTTLTRDAPAQELTLSRVPQKSVPGWRRPVK